MLKWIKRWVMPTFKWINKGGVRSAEGYALQRTERFTYRYDEGGRSLVFIVEPGIKNQYLSWPSAPAWQDGEKIDAATAAHIRENIDRALVFMGISYKWEE
ncbi:MAG: hypothetical protein ACO1TE_00615 [Prosthecobacter sp.]